MAMRKIKGFDPYERFHEVLAQEELDRRSNYRRTIEAMESVVPPERIQYLFYETLFQDDTARSVTDFLGIEPWPAKFDTIVNPGPAVPMKPEHRSAAFAAHRDVYDYVFQRFGDAVPMKWRQSAGLAASSQTG